MHEKFWGIGKFKATGHHKWHFERLIVKPILAASVIKTSKIVESTLTSPAKVPSSKYQIFGAGPNAEMVFTNVEVHSKNLRMERSWALVYELVARCDPGLRN